MFDCRDYQSECLVKIQDALDGGISRLLVSWPTGSGKAVLIAHIPRIHPGKTLVLVHREELVKQLWEKLSLVNPGLLVQIERADEYASTWADIIIASVPTFGKLSPQRRMRFNGFVNIIIDEAHHCYAQSYRNILEHFGVDCSGNFLKTPEGMLVLGVTATPRRTDGKGLDHIFQIVVDHLPLEYMIDQGWLVPIRYERVFSNVSLDNVGLKGGEYKEGELGLAVNTDYRNSLAVNAYKEYILGKKTIGFCSTVEHVENLTDLFCNSDVQAEMIVGETEHRKRLGVNARFKSGETPVLLGCQVFTEGYDVPDIQAVLMVKPTRSQTVYIQQIGRGLRPNVMLPINSTREERLQLIANSSKPFVTIIDIVDNAKKNSPIMLPVLVGLNKDIDLRGKLITDVAKKAKELRAEHTGMRIDLIKDVEQLQSLQLASQVVNIFEHRETPNSIKKLTKLSWLPYGEDQFEISPRKTDTIILQKDILNIWHAILQTTGSIDEKGVIQYHALQEIKLGSDKLLEALILRTEKWMNNIMYDGKEMRFLNRNAVWKAMPATEDQMKFLFKHCKTLAKQNNIWMIQQRNGFVPVTKGLAGEFITEKIKQWQSAKAKRAPMQSPVHVRNQKAF